MEPSHASRQVGIVEREGAENDRLGSRPSQVRHGIWAIAAVGGQQDAVCGALAKDHLLGFAEPFRGARVKLLPFDADACAKQRQEAYLLKMTFGRVDRGRELENESRTHAEPGDERQRLLAQMVLDMNAEDVG